MYRMYLLHDNDHQSLTQYDYNEIFFLQGERYDATTNNWSSIREMCTPRSNFGIEIIDDMIFVIGGYDGVTTIDQS